MNPEEWQQQAEILANAARETLDAIEAEFWPTPSDPSFRTFWPRIRELSDKLRTAPAIDIQAKLDLLGRIRQMTKKAREDQEVYVNEQRHRREELLDRIQELRSSALASSDPAEIRSLRQDLAAMRESVSELQLPVRNERQQTWQTWQTANNEVWDHLRTLWKKNEEELTALLTAAREQLNRGKVKEARDLIRDFNAASHTKEAPHKASRSLRAQANALWKEAEEVAKVKHETFMATAPDRVQRWKQVKGRNASAINRLRAEIGELEQNISAGGVAAAFARAMIDDKVRELHKLESSNDSLEERIESVETTLVG